MLAPTYSSSKRILCSNYFLRHSYRWRGLATPASEFHIPVIDFSKYQRATSLSQKQDTANEIVHAFKNAGFIYLANHGIPDPVINNVYAKSADFFRMPISIKDQLAWDDPRSNRGYVQQGRERVTQSKDAAEIAAMRATAPDCKESMEIGRDWDSVWKNKWPVERDCPGFKETMLSFFQFCHELHVSVMNSIALGLGLDESFFNDKINEQYHNLRLLSYPPVEREALNKEGQARVGAHSDYGTLTLLFQDSVGGLEVQNPHSGVFHPATPIPGTIVINVGDLLSRWSNDILRSTLHRVVAPQQQRPEDTKVTIPARQSIAFFCNPNGGALIDCLPNCYGPRNEKKYEAVTTEEYIVQRLSDTYS